MAFTLFFTCSSFSQKLPAGSLVVKNFIAASLKGNPAGEDPSRSITVYLPPGYYKSKRSYPVIYLLHGYTGTDTSTVEFLNLDKLMDTAIANNRIRPCIIVLPNSNTRYSGSFYTNSILNGNWANFIGKDVVNFVDNNFRTIAIRDSRGIAGISMGGHGALKLSMLYPDVYSSVYAMSPAILNWSDGMNTSIGTFEDISKAKTDAEIFKTFPTTLIVDLARCFSPDLNKPPFYADMPANYVNGNMVPDIDVIARWNANLPTQMVESHLPALKSMKAIKFDWGRNDEARHLPLTCIELTKKLERYGINHFAEEYRGGHIDQLAGTDGRFYNSVLPFFNRYLQFEP
ncbi:alpha/beta hydrolase [Mucilaginibacter sp. RCC_168]|uniref:alpha/beta hydrolase n=1 Tax=Mucilaginibacter sp. RCC_168 TaxID=3239221 RepID=UPI003523617E